MLQIAPHEDQAAGAALALGGGDAGLGAPDLAFEGVLPNALGFQEFFFTFLQFLVQQDDPGRKRGGVGDGPTSGARRAITSSARGATRRTGRNWNTKSTGTCRAGEHEREADRKQVERLEREIAGVEARLKETYDRVRTAIDERIRQARRGAAEGDL